MASITIRQLDDDLKRRLRLRAARNGRSMEDEARTILRNAASLEGGLGEARDGARQPAPPRGRVVADAPAPWRVPRRAGRAPPPPPPRNASSSSSAAASPPIRRSISSAG